MKGKTFSKVRNNIFAEMRQNVRNTEKIYNEILINVGFLLTTPKNTFSFNIGSFINFNNYYNHPQKTSRILFKKVIKFLEIVTPAFF